MAEWLGVVVLVFNQTKARVDSTGRQVSEFQASLNYIVRTCLGGWERLTKNIISLFFNSFSTHVGSLVLEID